MSKAKQLLDEYDSNPNADPDNNSIAATTQHIQFCSVKTLSEQVGAKFGKESITHLHDLIIRCKVPEDKSDLLAFFQERLAESRKRDVPLDIISQMCLEKLLEK